MQEVETVSKIRFLEQDFVYYIENESILLGLESFFVNVLGKLGYSKIERFKKELEPISTHKVSEKRSISLYSTGSIATHFFNYKVASGKFEDNPEKYKKYIEFVQEGGIKSLVRGICKKEELLFLPESENFPIADISHLVAKSQEVEKRENELQSKSKELELLQEKGLQLQKENETAIARLQMKENEYKAVSQRSEKVSNRLKEAEEKINSFESERNQDRLGTFLQQNSVKTYLTVFVICTFLPFTVGALIRYIPFAPVGGFQLAAFWALCIAMAFVWDSSILYFAKTGMQRMSRIGSFYQFLFFCAEFDLISALFGEYWQGVIVKLCIVSFSAVLVNQFTELSIKKENGND